MDADEYQREATRTWLADNDWSQIERITYLALGAANEAGELAGKIKKWLRDDREKVSMPFGLPTRGSKIFSIPAWPMSDERLEGIIGELGDTLWYPTVLAHELGVPLSSVMIRNIQKLHSRMERGRLRGDGDNR